MFVVGQRVRVLDDSKSISNLGIISLINTDDTYDIILSSKGNSGKDELTSVPQDLVSELQSFEIDDNHNGVDAEARKFQGNTLFSAKDYTAALEYYKRGIAALFPTSSNDSLGEYSMGSNVFVAYTDSLNLNTGMVSEVDISARTADVMIESTDADHEELAVPFSRLLPLSSEPKAQLLQRSLYMNMARCCLKLEQKGWAIKYASIALATSYAYATSAQECGETVALADLDKLMGDCYYFRAKALLAANRPKFATQDCKNLQLYDTTKAAALQKEIQSHKDRTARSNRKLARDIADWVSTAMGAEKGQGGADTADLGVMEEEGEDEEVQRGGAPAGRMEGHSKSPSVHSNSTTNTSSNSSSKYQKAEGKPPQRGTVSITTAVVILLLALLIYRTYIL